jgi:hypothetical protein
VRGLLDDDPAKRGARNSGLPVLGPPSAIADKTGCGAATPVIVPQCVAIVCVALSPQW